MGLNERNFLLIDRLKVLKQNSIYGTKAFLFSDYWEYLEAVAQLCSFHVRWKINCKKHSFLLKINDFKLEEAIDGTVRLYGELIGQSSSSFKYKVIGKAYNETVFKGELIIGTKPYRNNSDMETLSTHYKGILNCLQKDLN